MTRSDVTPQACQTALMRVVLKEVVLKEVVLKEVVLKEVLLAPTTILTWYCVLVMMTRDISPLSQART